MDTLLPIVYFFFFFFFFWGGGVFNVKFTLFFIVFFFCNFKYLFEKVKISLIGGGGGIARHTRYFKVVQSKVGAGIQQLSD